MKSGRVSNRHIEVDDLCGARLLSCHGVPENLEELSRHCAVGGFLPLIATATTQSDRAAETFGSNAIYTGFIYACGVCLPTAIVGMLLIKEMKDRKIARRSAELSR